jgi:DNA-binding GntR family transcriptional regulator
MMDLPDQAAGRDRTGAREAGPTSVSPDEAVYQTLYDAIIDRRLKPGAKLKEMHLAEAFGVTRGVVRKALARLAATKLVSLRNQHGATVAAPSKKDVAEIFESRRLVEAHLTGVLANSPHRGRLKELKDLLKRERDAYRAGDTRTGIKLSMEFHVRLAALAGNEVLAEFLEQLIARTPVIVMPHGEPEHRASCSEDEHQNIVSAIRSGDRDKAVALMLTHLDHLESHVAPATEPRKSELAHLLGLDSKD